MMFCFNFVLNVFINIKLKFAFFEHASQQMSKQKTFLSKNISTFRISIKSRVVSRIFGMYNLTVVMSCSMAYFLMSVCNSYLCSHCSALGTQNSEESR